MSELSTFIAVLLIGSIVGIISGLFGVGGGFLMVPALSIFAGVSPEIAVGSSICQMLGPATTGLLHRYSNNQLQMQLPLTMTGGVLFGLYWGFQFLKWVEGPTFEQTMMSVYLVILLALAFIVGVEYYFARFSRKESRQGVLENWNIPPSATLPELDNRVCSIPILTTLGLFIGFLSGGLGMGGGILLLPMLIFLVGINTHQAISVALGVAFITGCIATVGHSLAGNVDWRLVCLLLVGGTSGAKIGSMLGDQWGGRKIRGYFAWIILAVAGLVAWRLYTGRI